MTDPAKVLFRNASPTTALTRTLAAAMAGSADLGEAMATARRIGKPSGTAWYDAWSKTADQARQTAEKTRASGERAERSSWLPAGQRVLPPGLPISCARTSTAAASKTPTVPTSTRSDRRRADGPPCRGRPHPLRLHNGQPGYLFAPDGAGEAEADCHLSVRVRHRPRKPGWATSSAAVERGYNALVFEGPGQGEALYTQRLFLRPDFEHVLTPVLDWLLTRPEVQPDALVLIGRSSSRLPRPPGRLFRPPPSRLGLRPGATGHGRPHPRRRWRESSPLPLVKAQMRMSADRAEFFGARMAAHGLDTLRSTSPSCASSPCSRTRRRSPAPP